MASWAALVLWAATLPAGAQDLEPRTYTNTPVGLNFVIVGYAYQTGDVLADPALPIENAKLHSHNAVIAYARAFGLFGTSAKADVILPYSWVSGSAKIGGRLFQRDVDGLSDPRFRLSVNLYGAPALSLEEFAGYQQDLIVGASFLVWPPLGQYDHDKLLNIGTNRWAFRPEIGISKALGPLTLEVAPSATFFTDNDEFFGDKLREQAPIYAVQGHVIYRFHDAVWGAVDATYYGGGTTTIDGVESDNRQSNVRVGGTLALSVNRNNSIKLYATTAAATRIGGDFTTVGIAWQYRWGGGL